MVKPIDLSVAQENRADGTRRTISLRNAYDNYVMPQDNQRLPGAQDTAPNPEPRGLQPPAA